METNASHAEIIISDKFIKQMKIVRNHERNSFSIDPTLVESVESINSDLLDVDDRRLAN